MTPFQLIAAGGGIMTVLAFVLAAIVDVVWISTGHTSISKRCLIAGQRYPWIAAMISAVLALIMGMLLGHLFLGQVNAPPTPTACSCRPGATCAGKCPKPCACRPQPGDVAAAIDASTGDTSAEAPNDASVRVTRCCYAQPVPEAKPLLLAFKQKINPVCIKMKRELDKRPDVKTAVSKAYDLRIYDWVADKDQCDKYAVNDVPTCVVVDPATGKEVKRFIGYKSPNEILRWLDLPCPH